MAEFQKVMRQWRRMCEKNHGECMARCPICANPVCGELAEADDEYIRKAEDAIMAWAADHPEPEYPTWGEYLCNIGLIHDCTDVVEMVHRLFHNSVPADIAQKLGIEPKEGI